MYQSPVNQYLWQQILAKQQPAQSGKAGANPMASASFLSQEVVFVPVYKETQKKWFSTENLITAGEFFKKLSDIGI